jgi:PQQ-dependent dehydrogenase (methanol/ethanol family)
MRAFRLVTVIALWGLFSMTAVAMDLAQTIDFKIAPQRLATALLEFSHQANVQIVVGSEVGDRLSAGLSGRHSIAQGLTALLQGSALVYRVVNDTSITVGNSDSSQTLPSAAGPLTPTTAKAEWPFLGGNPESQQYSALDQINSKNVGSLGLLWYSDLSIPEGLVGNPLVKDGVVYQGAPWGRALATDIQSGKTLWAFDSHLNLANYSVIAMYIATITRGLGMDENNVYAAGGCSLYAVDRKTGKEVWESQICNPAEDLGANSAPRVGGGKVFVGIGNMQMGSARGYAAGYDAKTGKELWRFYTVPGDPTKPYENKQMEMAAKTWGDRYWIDTRGSGSVWEGMIYDPKTDLLIFGAGNPGVDGHEREFSGKAMLFSGSLIAVNASTGEYVWHLQEVTGDVFHPGDATAHLQLADLRIDGRVRHVLMQAAKNGYFDVIDANTGRMISANNYVPVVNWKPMDMKTGTLAYREGLDFWNYPPGKTEILQPGGFGAHTWELCSYNPDTGLVYIPAFIFPYGLSRDGRDEYAGFSKDAKYPNQGLLIAWDPVAQKERWHVAHPVTVNGGVLSTAGKIVLQGTPGRLYAYDATTGKTLWSYDTHSVILGAPSTVMVNGRQVILVPSGDGNAVAISKTARLSTTPESMSAPSRLLAFSLDGNTKLPPAMPKMVLKPVLAKQPSDVAARGRSIFEEHYCGACHGGNLISSGNGRIPDLRNIRESTLHMMPQIIRQGAYRSMGMPQFPEITDQDITALQAYITNEAWAAYENQGIPEDAARAH